MKVHLFFWTEVEADDESVFRLWSKVMEQNLYYTANENIRVV
jgi:hypothetical protein